MLKIVEGGLYSNAYDEIKAEILALTKEKKSVYFIVPEQQAVLCEKENDCLSSGLCSAYV